MITINMKGENRVFKLLEKIEFTSERKRMTVVVEEVGKASDYVYVFSKGADSVMYDLNDTSVEQLYVNESLQRIYYFSS